MRAALILLLALPPRLLWAAANVTHTPEGHPIEALALPAPAVPLAAPTLPSSGALDLSAPPASVSADAVPASASADPALSAPGAPSAETRAAADPRREGFETRAWTEAERLGFERAVPPSEDTQAGSAPDASAPTLSPAPASRPEAPKPPQPPKPRKLLSGSVLGFISSFALVQVTVESLGLAVPQMSDPLTQGFLALGALSSISYVAYSLGALAGGHLVERFGIRKVYPIVLVTRALVWTAAAMLFDPTLQTVPIVQLTALFSLDYFAHSIGRVAEHTLQAAWFDGTPALASRFGAIRDFIEYGTVFAMLGTGVLISTMGFGAVVYATPFLFGAAALIAAFLRGLPGPTEAEHAVKGFWVGFKALFADRTSRLLFLGQALLNNFFYLFYYITATAFGVFASHGNSAHSALASSALTGAYGIGGLLSAFVVAAITGRITRSIAGLDEKAQKGAELAAMTRAGSKALIWAAAALLGAWLFVFQNPLGTLVWPFYAVMPALAAIGITAQVATNLLDGVFKSRLAPETKANVVGAARMLTYLSYAASFIVWGGIFQLLGVHGFIAMGVYATLIAAGYVWLAAKLRR